MTSKEEAQKLTLGRKILFWKKRRKAKYRNREGVHRMALAEWKRETKSSWLQRGDGHGNKKRSSTGQEKSACKHSTWALCTHALRLVSVFICMSMHKHTATHWGLWILWRWSYRRFKAPSGCAGNWAQVLCESKAPSTAAPSLRTYMCFLIQDFEEKMVSVHQ